MARRKDSPQKAAMREMMRDYLKNNDISIKDGTDVNSIMRDMMSVILEGALDEELDEELGYSKYDYRNKETDKILPIVKEWQERPLEEVYAVVFMDAIHYHVRSEGRIVKRAVYIALGIDMNGKKIQQCIIHQIRNSTKFVSYKNIKKLMADLKLVYAAPTEETALNELELFKDKWDSKYPKIYKSWHDNWATLSTYFKYPEAVRRLIYTTNAIEGFNRQLRKVTKSKTVFPSDDSLLKMLYLATMDITKKWTGHRQDWGQIHSQLEIYFEERLIGRNL